MLRYKVKNYATKINCDNQLKKTDDLRFQVSKADTSEKRKPVIS